MRLRTLETCVFLCHSVRWPVATAVSMEHLSVEGKVHWRCVIQSLYCQIALRSCKFRCCPHLGVFWYIKFSWVSTQSRRVQALEGGWISRSHCGPEEDRMDAIRLGEGIAAVPTMTSAFGYCTVVSIAPHILLLGRRCTLMHG